MAMTRRGLLAGMAKLGGAGAAYETLAAWEFLKPPPAMAASLALPKESGRGRTVAILGAGVSGLCAAYELDRAGYDCVILEPSRRTGGRSLTLRRGDAFREMDGELQVCLIDEGLWFNAGPGRIPHHHVHVIDYCRRFGVALQPYIFASRANLVHSGKLGNGRTMPVREVLYSLQGHVSELLAKCSKGRDLNAPLSTDDLDTLQHLLEKFGDLTATGEGHNKTYSYTNQSGRAGFETPPGVAQPGRPISPMQLDDILRSEVWKSALFRDAEIYWQTSLMEPVGGMDKFYKGFLRQPLARQAGSLDALVRFGAKATGIALSEDKVAIRYDDAGTARTLEADYCVCTIPSPILARMQTNLPAAFMRAAADLPVGPAGKIGFQAERFWERESNIYGGISWTTDLIDQIWYPSHDYLSPKGILTGGYVQGDDAIVFNRKPVAERLHIAREQGERLHPGYAKHVEHGIALAWERMEFQQCAWAEEGFPTFQANAEVLSKPYGRFHMAGDQVTFWSGWQEGAIIAAWHAVTAIDRHARG